jgi:hypothetical protein
MVMKVSLFRDITPCSQPRFRGNTLPQYSGLNNEPNKKPARKQLATNYHPGFFLGLLFHPEDMGEMFLGYVGLHSTV